MQAQGIETVTTSGYKKLFGITDRCAYKRLVMKSHFLESSFDRAL